MALAVAAPAAATVPRISIDPAKAYVAARAASISGDHAGAAEIYARLATGSADADLKQKAIAEAISAGDMGLAIRLLRDIPQAQMSIDSKLVLVADALKRGQDADAIRLLGKAGNDADLSFWIPLVQAWSAAEHRNPAVAITTLAGVPRNSAFAPFVDEEAALILLKLGKSADAEPHARRAIGSAGPREYRLRLALAAGFAKANDRPRALAMIEGISGDTSAIQQAVLTGGLKTAVIDSAAEAFSEQLIALALEMRRARNASGTPVNVAQVARFAAPENSSAAILVGSFLADEGRLPEAIAAFRSVGDGDPLKPEALDAEGRALSEAKLYTEALALAQKAVGTPTATSDDYARLGDIYSSMKRYGEAAEAYKQALARTPKGETARIWPLLLLQASVLESANRWPEAKAALASAIAIAPSEPLILNFMGYAKLEHGEDLDAAEAMIRKASELAPDDASITDSLGWALYKRGRLEEAIEVLQKAAAGDPSQAEIQEHLGDALYAAGRKFEARFAWQAALATADEEETARIRAKIEGGLTQATTAP